MINPKQYLTDNRARLRGFEPQGEENGKRGDQFMRELIANTSQHPFNNNANP